MEIAIFIAAVLILYIVLKLLSVPMKIVAKFLANAIIGGIVIYILNLLGLGINLTWINSAIVGFLGVPGVIIVAIIQYLL